MKHNVNKTHLKTIEYSSSYDLNHSNYNVKYNNIFSVKIPTTAITIDKYRQKKLFISTLSNNEYFNKNKNKTNKIFSKSINELFIKDVKESLRHNKTETHLFNKKFARINLSDKKYYILSQKNIKNKSLDRKYKEKVNLMFGNIVIKNELIKKRSIKSASTENAIKRENIFKNIPLSIKGYQKKMTDIFHSRQIQDRNYQNHYKKQRANIKDILYYHRINKRNFFRGEKIPSYHYNKFNKSTNKINNKNQQNGNKFKYNIFLLKFDKN